MANRQTAICILGMHRSGTSLVAELLEACGVFLGDESELLEAQPDDNAHGYFENKGFVDLDEAILKHFGGSWHDLPNLRPGWESDPSLEPLRDRAKSLVAGLANHGTWGWKDPRSCLLLPFWNLIVPDAKLVLCVRSPGEVAQSFSKRQHANLPAVRALDLWRLYNESALAAIGDRPVLVTHYLAYQFDPEAELRRVLDFLGLSEDGAAGAISRVDRSLAHGFTTQESLAEPIRTLYDRLCERSGPVYQQAMADRGFSSRQEADKLAKALARIEALEGLVQTQVAELGQLRGTVNYLNGRLSPGERARWRGLEFLRKIKARLRAR